MSMFSDSLRAFLKPVVPLLDDPEVSEVLINGPREVWVERRGKLYATECVFTEEGLLAAARNMAQYVGRPLTDERPRLDARLPDGSRIHVVLPPLARRGTTISIRKFFAEKLTPKKLLELGTMTAGMARFLEACVHVELNVVVAGGTGSGKTSLLNVLSSFIPEDERILTIEDSAELQLQQKHLVTFESRPPDKFGKGGVDIGDLLHSALRLRPDRILVGEVRGGEAFHLLQAMNTGHGGTLTTAHANSPVDTLRRLESLCLLSGIELPLRAVRAQVASAVHLVVCCARLPDGSRKVTYVSEVLPLDAQGEYRVQDLFLYVQTGRGEGGKVLGHHAPTGLLPTFLGRIAAAGFDDVGAAFFDPLAQGVSRPPAFAAGLGESSRWATGSAPGAAASTGLAGSATAAAAPGAIGENASALAGDARATAPVAAGTQPGPASRAATAAAGGESGAASRTGAAAGASASGATSRTGAAAGASASGPAGHSGAGTAGAPETLEATDASGAFALVPGVTDASARALDQETAESTGSISPAPSHSRSTAPAPSHSNAPSPPHPTAASTSNASSTSTSPATPPSPAAARPMHALPRDATREARERAPGATGTAAVLPVPPVPRPTPAPLQAARPPAQKPAAPAVAPRSTPPAPAPPRAAEPSIQLDPELAAEVARSLPTESTLITRNPLLDGRPQKAPATEEDTHPRARSPKRDAT